MTVTILSRSTDDMARWRYGNSDTDVAKLFHFSSDTYSVFGGIFTVCTAPGECLVASNINGDELKVVIQGTLVIREIDTNRTWTLNPGESFTARRGDSVSYASETGATVLWTATAPGEPHDNAPFGDEGLTGRPLSSPSWSEL
ncbi:hypothetical protein [Rhodococcus globerulus]|uniref:hypothetical protein n=1 Tax=Rhodococcus globerulus TaxID=33008 RepID=UPI001C5822A4|nr:hypothetical protein [Rhodococcus globerulus]QXW01348.1 hypothetical protein KYT97_23885 [Rhodococcus globerulus]